MDIAENRAPRPSVLSAAGRAPRGPGRLRRRVAGRSLLALRFALLASALAFAPPAAASETEGDAAPAVFAARELIPDGTAVRVLGRDVRGPSGQVVAQVVNVLVDGSGRPLAAVLDYGGFMGVGQAQGRRGVARAELRAGRDAGQQRHRAGPEQGPAERLPGPQGRRADRCRGPAGA